MAEKFYSIQQWSEYYMEMMGQLYGREELSPRQNIEETNLEWVQIFMEKSDSPDEGRDISNWTEPYLDVYEMLFGPLYTQPAMTVEELNEIWRDLYFDSSIPQVIKKIA